MKSLSFTGAFLILVMTMCTTGFCAGWQVPLPETAGIRLYVEKQSYDPTRPCALCSFIMQ